MMNILDKEADTVVDIKKNPTLKTFYRTLEPYKTQTPSS